MKEGSPTSQDRTASGDLFSYWLSSHSNQKAVVCAVLTLGKKVYVSFKNKPIPDFTDTNELEIYCDHIRYGYTNYYQVEYCKP